MRLSFCAFLAIGVVLLGSGCTPKSAEAVAAATATTTTVGYDSTVDLAPGESLQLEKSTSNFTFLGVASDNRCPKGVNCIQAGAAVVRIGLPDGGVRELTVRAGEKTLPRFSVKDGLVQLLALNPYPEYENNIPEQDYRLRLKIMPAAAQ
ncbi:hypothetical protein [Lewinella sp. W8]|uniref:hypothetical protein n=1 Tax=Lewinella sp. W8 TaxID=2528208 RepID=UPI001067241B|nr:hypothetical protein [Lewinella sp. W8]MTB51679.1 hypothetical protein [Lewinella sp. W8]